MKLPVELMKTLNLHNSFYLSLLDGRLNLMGFSCEAKSYMNDKFGCRLINFVKGNDYFKSYTLAI